MKMDSYLPYKKGKVEKIHVRADGSKEKVESAVSITALQQSHLPARQKRQEPDTMENLSKKRSRSLEDIARDTVGKKKKENTEGRDKEQEVAELVLSQELSTQDN